MTKNDLTDLPGVGPGTEKKLKEAGINTFMAIAVLTPAQISECTGMTEAASRKLISAARENCAIGFVTGEQMEENDEQKKEKYGSIYISTHCEAIDKLLGGGIRLGTSMEAYGESESGKSNLSHLLAASTIKTFPGSYVVFIDTESKFSPRRFSSFCKGLGIDPKESLKYVIVGQSFNSDHQQLLTEEIDNMVENQGKDIKMLIVDSLMHHFRAEYLGRGTLSNRQQMINGYLNRISNLIHKHGMAVYMVNQIQMDPGLSFGDPTKAIGGSIVAHYCTTRVYMRKAAKGTRKMILKDSPDLPEGEAIFKIKETCLESVSMKTVEEV